MKSESGQVKKPNEIVTFLFSIIILVVLYVVGVGKPTLLQKMIKSWRIAHGISLEQLNATTEMQILRDSGIPEEAIYAYILSPVYDLDASLYPVNHGVLVQMGDPPYKEWTLKDAKYSQIEEEQLPVVVEKIEPVKKGYYSYAKIEFGTFPPETYHQTFTIPTIRVYGTQANIARQLNWQPWELARRDIKFFVVSPEELSILVEVRRMCKAKYCLIPNFEMLQEE